MKDINEIKEKIIAAIEDICKEEKEPEFKVGQWAAFESGGEIFPFLIHHFKNDKVYGQEFVDKNDLYKIEWKCDLTELVSVTPEEIEAHLKKICEKKGFFKFGNKFKSIFDDNGKIREIQPYSGHDEIEWAYHEHDDSLYCDNGMKTSRGFCSNPRIYVEGKFAEIVEEKKPLPGYREFLNSYHKYTESYIPDNTINAFLNQYDI